MIKAGVPPAFAVMAMVTLLALFSVMHIFCLVAAVAAGLQFFLTQCAPMTIHAGK